MNKSLLAQHRRAVLAGAHGDVVEIGFGTGLNLPYYPKGVHKLTAVDPNPGMHRLAQKRIKQARIEVDQQVLGGERLPFEDSRFDCAVSTFTLCSIEDVAQALRESAQVELVAGLTPSLSLHAPPHRRTAARRVPFVPYRKSARARSDGFFSSTTVRSTGMGEGMIPLTRLGLFSSLP
jgi:ubiquinone/menaquinone biosynthesis C-methylase UbiE